MGRSTVRCQSQVRFSDVGAHTTQGSCWQRQLLLLDKQDTAHAARHACVVVVSLLVCSKSAGWAVSKPTRFSVEICKPFCRSMFTASPR
jgi:hypothetical protein